MPTDVVMPKMGLTMTEGTISKWLKQEGDQVEKGEPLLEVSTDKVETEVESPASGVLAKIFAPEGQTVEVTKVIAVLAAPGEKLSESDLAGPSAGEAKPEPQAEEKKAGDETPAPSPASQSRGKIKASPKAKRLARERGIDLSQLQGTGPGGRIVAKDVETYEPPVEKPAPAPREAVAAGDGDETVELKGMRKVIAERMSQSFSEKPHVTLNSRVDVRKFQKLRKKINAHLEKSGSKVTFNDLLLKVTALALARHREMNAVYENEQIIKRREVNIGLAVAVDEGLVVPVVRNAAARPLSELSTETRDLIERARSGNLNPDEFQGGTFTLTNLGMYGIENFTPIINPPEVGILGVGQIEKVPAVNDEDEIVVKPMMYLSLSFDHRIVDGAQAALFLQTLKQIIEEPDMIWTL